MHRGVYRWCGRGWTGEALQKGVKAETLLVQRGVGSQMSF